MMMPEAWQNSDVMDEDRKAFYKFHAALMEPWDGPALVCFTDGQFMGASLDRNGLRPCRYYQTSDNRVIGGSEVGVLEIDEATVVKKGRLLPGKMFLIDFEKGRLISDEEYKGMLIAKNPYKEWVKNQEVTIRKLEDEVADFEEQLESKVEEKITELKSELEDESSKKVRGARL